MKKAILVLGGAGYIGSHISYLLSNIRLRSNYYYLYGL